MGMVANELISAISRVEAALKGPPRGALAKAWTQLLHAIDQVSDNLAEVQAQNRTIEDRVEHVERWYGCRLERLSKWARGLETEAQEQFFNIVANGTATPYEAPTYAQMLARLTHERDRARAEVERMLYTDDDEVTVRNATAEADRLRAVEAAAFRVWEAESQTRLPHTCLVSDPRDLCLGCGQDREAGVAWAELRKALRAKTAKK